MTWLGVAWLGKAWRGPAWHGEVGHGLGVVWTWGEVVSEAE
jgi:hypothetical protein